MDAGFNLRLYDTFSRINVFLGFIVLAHMSSEILDLLIDSVGRVCIPLLAVYRLLHVLVSA